MKPNQILLVGNGSYHNRGCEAIVRGTTKILRAEFGDDTAFPAGIYAADEVIAKQRQNETDKAVDTFALRVKRDRGSRDWFAHQINRVLKTNLAGVHGPIQNRVAGSMAALEIGGDNYSLDYGIPGHFLAMDNFLKNRKVPVFMWGASIGPFDANPEFESQMRTHLSSLTGVFVRESFSREYLAKIGVESNVRQIADPAFLLTPEEPPAEVAELVTNRPIGVNLSPLVAKKFISSPKMPWEINEQDLKPFVGFCVELIESMLTSFEDGILLMPHVTSGLVGSDDGYVLGQIYKGLAKHHERVKLVPTILNGAQSKWMIGKCKAFVGARTHSTIAAMGSGVPTLSLSYSMKARGINQDVFGTQDFCFPSNNLEMNPLLDSIKNLVVNESHIRDHLKEKLPEVRSAAMAAGPHLRELAANG